MPAEELKLSNREQALKILEPTEGLSSFDVEPDDSPIEFKTSDSGIQVTAKDVAYKLNKKGYITAARNIGLSRSYVEKSPINLVLQNLNYWLGEKLTHRTRFIVKQDEVISISPVCIDIISNQNLLTSVERTFGQNGVLGYHQIHTDLRFSRFAVVGTEYSEPVEGDRIYGGIAVQNSILGERRVEISAYIFRQWCTNGAISADTISGWSRRKDVFEVGAWAEETSREAYSSLNSEFAKLDRLVETKVNGNTESILKSIFNKYDISMKLQKEITEEAATSKPKTMYDIYNCITKIATHSKGIRPDISRYIQLVGGEVAKYSETCPTCHRVLS